MKQQIKTIEQLRDSRLLFEKNPPKFGYILLLIFTFSIVAIIIWSIFAHKNYMIISKGTITDRDASYVMTPYTGVIEECRLQEDTNYFDTSDSLYYDIYETYKSQIQQNIFDASTYKSYGYSDEQIEIEMKKNQGKLSELYYSTLQSVENSMEEVKLQIASIEAQITALQSGKNEYEIKASTTGVLHLMADYKEGVVAQAGSAVATITPENGDMIIEAYVSTSDVARMKETDNVQIVVDGLAQSVYGNITGIVKSIDSNSTSIEGENGQTSSVFKIEIVPDSDYLISKSGNKVKLINGMTVEVRITYDEITYFNLNYS